MQNMSLERPLLAFKWLDPQAPVAAMNPSFIDGRNIHFNNSRQAPDVGPGHQA